MKSAQEKRKLTAIKYSDLINRCASPLGESLVGNGKRARYHNSANKLNSCLNRNPTGGKYYSS